MYQKSIEQLSADLHSGEYSSVELTRCFLDRIKSLDGQLNSFITLSEEVALQQAQQADDLLHKGTAGVLTGIPLAQKDIFCTKGTRTTCASKMLDNFIAPYDATVVDKLNQAGTVMLGKTNMDEFAMGSSNETSFYGAVSNPWNTNTVPGGSSGGSASAVAARLTPAATGTDTGGSIRQPASLCGITGIKPTYGRVSRYGMIAFASSLDQGGVMTQTAEDAALLMNVIAGFDPKDSTSVDYPVDDYTADLNRPLEGLKIGIPREYFGDGLDPKVEQVIQTALKTYEKLGASLHEISLANTHLSIPASYVVAPAECSSNLSRFDGVRFGYRCENPVDLYDLYSRSRGEAFGDEVKRRIMIGAYALSTGYYDAYYLKAQKIRRIISNDFTQAFEQVDVIMGPASPSTAFEKNAKSDDPVAMYLSDIYTISVNLAGLPGMSIPAGFIDGMPVGLQIIGQAFAEAKLLNVAHQFQQLTDYHAQIPANFSQA